MALASDRIDIPSGDSISEWREKLNDNFIELFSPDYFYGFHSGSDLATVASISSKTWTTVAFSDQSVNTSSVTWGASDTEMTFPVVETGGASSNTTGLWNFLASIGFDNRTTGLEGHMRRVAIEQYSNTLPFWIPFGLADSYFDPDSISSPIEDDEKVSVIQAYLQGGVGLESTQDTDVNKVRVRVWHNATVGGSPVSLNILKRGVYSHQFAAVRLCNSVET